MIKRIVGCGVFCVIILIAFCGLASAQSNSSASEFDQVILQLKWKHQFQFAGYYAAIEKGFYAEEGIQVELVEPRMGEEPAHRVFQDSAHFGVSTADILITRSEGYHPVLLASIFQHSAQVLIASKESEIKYAQELLGKKIALEPHAADIITYMNDEGISLDDVTLYPHSFDVSSLTSGQVDALTAYISDEPFSLREGGFDYTIIDPSMGGIDFYGDLLFTTEELMKKDPGLVTRFRNASLKGWEYAMENEEEIVNLIYDKYSQRHSKDHLRFEAEQMQRLIMPNVVEIGYSNPGRWNRILEIYQEQDMLASPISLEGFFYHDYIRTEKNIPWRIFAFFGMALLIIASATLFYYNLAQKLRKESEKRLKTQKLLQEREHRLKELNAAKDKFFSIIAHDLRNPFSAVVGTTELLMMDAREKNDENLLESLELIRNTSLRTSDLLNNLLIWSRAQIGKIEFTPEKFDPKDVIEENLKLLEAKARQKQIKIYTHFDESGHIWGDRNMINTTMLNLTINAIKFTHIGGRVDVGITQTNNAIQFYVKDNGVGISEENQKKLFSIEEKFTSEGTSAEKGSGLGLLLCKEFVDNHGGEIWVESEPGEGSVFRFNIPKTREL